MVDFTKKKYAEWLEEILPQLFELDPESIGIVAIMKDWTQATSYFNCDNSDRVQMVRSIFQDCLKDWIIVNADMIRGIFDSDDDGDEQ